MRQIRKFIRWWKSFEYPIDRTPDSSFTIYKGQKEEKHWCPLCGYSGTADNIRCHILNDHRGI